MSNELFCSLILAGLGLWTLFWIFQTHGSNEQLDRIMQEAEAEGRKVSFWVKPKGRKIGAWITFVSIILWILCLFAFSFYVDENLICGFLHLALMSGVIVFWVLIFVLIISKIFGIGVANYKPSPEELERAQKIIEEREKAQERLYSQKDDDTPFFLS